MLLWLSPDSWVARPALAISDGEPVRILDGAILVGDAEVARGRVLDEASVEVEMERARAGLSTQLAGLSHNSTEFLRREQDLLLHGLGVPRLAARIAGRPVVVVAGDDEYDAELAGVRTFIREQHPVVIAVGATADALKGSGIRADVIVVDSADVLPSAAVLRAASDVVVRADRGRTPAVLDQIERHRSPARPDAARAARSGRGPRGSAPGPHGPRRRSRRAARPRTAGRPRSRPR